MPEVFEARPKKSRLLLYILACVIFVAASVWMLFVPGALSNSRRSPEVLTVAAWIGLPFFTIGLVIFARMFLSSEPQIRIDQHGLFWKRWSPEPIPFAAIDDSWTAQVARQQFLCLTLHDPAQYPARSVLLRATAGANRAMGTGDVAITTNGLDRSPEELFAAFNLWRAAVGGR